MFVCRPTNRIAVDGEGLRGEDGGGGDDTGELAHQVPAPGVATEPHIQSKVLLLTLSILFLYGAPDQVAEEVDRVDPELPQLPVPPALLH